MAAMAACGRWADQVQNQLQGRSGAMEFKDACGGDGFVQQELANLVRQHGIASIIETGTFDGRTTRFLASLAQHVLSIGIDPIGFQTCRQLAGLENVWWMLGNTADMILRYVPHLPGPYLFYLDAQWGPQWPIWSELRAVEELGLAPIIVIPDFKVPGTGLGFDASGGVELSYVAIATSIDAIYGQGRSRYRTNSDATTAGARRGIAYFEPAARPDA
jgi:hypothetical protein